MTARGIRETGIEGSYDSISRSSAGDYPSLGISQWEGERGDALLLALPGGKMYAGRTWSGIALAGEIPALRRLLASDIGRRVQEAKLYEDSLAYQEALSEFPEMQPSARVYAGMWCPTSDAVVCAFLRNRRTRGIEEAETLHRLFFKEYARAADAERFREGYERRAEVTWEFVKKEFGP